MKTSAIVILTAAAIAAGAFFHWTINRIYVPVGHSLQLRYKGPLSQMLGIDAKTAKPGYWAQEGEVGILQKLRGPGRHFYCPIWWERRIVPDVMIEPGSLGIVTCMLGEPLPAGEFLVDGDIGTTQHQGILRKVLTPGRYRINPYGYKTQIVQVDKVGANDQPKYSGWVRVPTGYVGVVTNLASNPQQQQVAGIQERVLPPGLYPMNPRERQVDVVKIGYRESTIAVTNKLGADGSLALDEAGEPIVQGDEGIMFPSSDGFQINLDFTAIWGIMPEQAPHAVRMFGNVNQVENKVVLPQIESICRNNGSKYSAVDLLVGEKREVYQSDTLEDFHTVLDEKQISLLYGLVRHIYIPREVREPIQQAFIADELRLTREQEQLTARAEADLREAEKRVELESEKVRSDTKRQVAARLAEGQKQVGEIAAEGRKMVAAIEKESAVLEAEATVVLGQAENDGVRLIEEARADKFKLAVDAFGSPAAYTNWIFASGLPEDIDLKLLYAGEGTLWTDLDDVGLRANVPVKQGEEASPMNPASTQQTSTKPPGVK